MIDNTATEALMKEKLKQHFRQNADFYQYVILAFLFLMIVSFI